MSRSFNEVLGTAILGMDTLWGGDVMCPSGTGRFIADSWFSGEPLPAAYTHPARQRPSANRAESRQGSPTGRPSTPTSRPSTFRLRCTA